MASGAGGAASAGSGGSSGSSSSGSLARDDSKWYFTAEQLDKSPSRKQGMDADQELMYRQRAANLIQDMGQRLQVSQLCINTAIVYMHRFYAFHSFTQFHRNSIAAAALFLAAKVEEQPRKLEHIIKVVHICLGMEAPDPLKENYAEQAQDLVFNENVLLQTLGFDVAIDHPHTHVVKTCHLVKASKDLAQTSYFMASNSLHLTTMCLQYKPTVVACFCIHLACKWSRWEIPQSNEGRHWFHYVDKSVTLDLLKQLTDEFLHIFDRCPTRLKSKMKSIRADQPQADDSSRRSSSAMPSSSSSAIPRGIDDAGSSSSHHRSSSHSHSKQSSSSGDPSLKASQSSSHKIPSSGSSRSRGDRPPSSSSQALHQREMMSGAGGGHYGTSSSSSKMQPIPHHSSSRSGMPPQSSSSSSSSSSRYGNMHESSRDPKNRMMPTATGSSSSSSMPMHPYSQSKVDRHGVSSGQKGPSLSLMDGKNQGKSQNSMMAAPLFSGSNPDLSSRSSASSLMKQPYGSHPPSYSQSMSNRNNNMPSSESQSVPNQQTQQQQFKNQMQQQLPSAGAESSFRLIDDSNRLTEPMQMSTPPKQSKPSSIFSPDWKDTQAESNNGSVSNSGGKSRSQGQLNANIQKTIKESPSSREKKPSVPTYPDQQHKSRSITPKKERRTEAVTTPSSSQQPRSTEKKPPSSSSLKRSLETPLSGSMSGSTLDPTDLLGINKISSGQAPMKRSLHSSEQVRQEDGTDFRESKVRKVEISSPSDNLFSSSFDLSSTFDKQDDSFSMFPFNDPGSLLSQPLLSDSKPINIGKTSFSNTINGIETNPALVSSLLKESLCGTESKFSSLSGSATNALGFASSSSTTNNSTVASTGSSLLTSAASSQSVSSLSASSAPSLVPNVPETIKTEPQTIDVNAPSAISSLLAQSAPLLSTASTLTTANTNTASSELVALTGDTATALSKEEEHRRSKSEKKKKKDKHKHKEKDKTKDKDREERKKHKKDKDRHRDREREKTDQASDPALIPGPIKIKLPKDKLNLHPLTESTTGGSNPAAAAASDIGLKIKIPKDRLSGASSLSGSSTSASTAHSGAAVPATGSTSSQPSTLAPNPLKLKISKDKIEHYNINDSGFNNGSGHGGHGGAHHSHSSKKKDRDKERDKSKSNKSSTSTSSTAAVTAGMGPLIINDYNKQNGNSGAGGSSASGGQTGSSSSKSSSSKLTVSSAQQQYSLNNMMTDQLMPSTGGPQHPASFDYMQHAQAPTLQQQQYFSQFGAFSSQQQQQQPNVLTSNSASKMAGNTSLGTSLQNFYYGTNNPNNNNNTVKK
ncbi:cyclin-T [Armigeres subalbatus]|uniref:cyclin-T n=1 Tax=Armigeres subalbatus TaxID=124917 RepID=UPI002ED03E68